MSEHVYPEPSQPEQQRAIPEQGLQVQVEIDGKMFTKTILPPVTREYMSNGKGGLKNLPPKSRPLTEAEEQFLDNNRWDARQIYDRKFSDYGSVNNNAPQDVSWDNPNKVNGAHITQDELLNEDEMHDQDRTLE